VVLSKHAQCRQKACLAKCKTTGARVLFPTRLPKVCNDGCVLGQSWRKTTELSSHSLRSPDGSGTRFDRCHALIAGLFALNFEELFTRRVRIIGSVQVQQDRLLKCVEPILTCHRRLQFAPAKVPVLLFSFLPVIVIPLGRAIEIVGKLRLSSPTEMARRSASRAYGVAFSYPNVKKVFSARHVAQF
jgi:hypothetical protein